MTARLLLDRWKSPEGRALAAQALDCLTGTSTGLPEGFGTHEGRRDLRGLVAASREVRDRVSPGRVTAGVTYASVELRGLRWEALDLSHARLPSLRFFGAEVRDCRFDKASCDDWRLWDTEVSDSSFAGADLRESALGTWHDGQRNTWRAVSFDRADLRRTSLMGCLMVGCTFRGTRLSQAHFEQVAMNDCTFSGVVKNALFDCRELPGRPPPDVMRNVDFGDATFEDVEFRGCRFDRVTLPQTPDVYAIPDYPRVARRMLGLLAEDPSLEARMLRAELNGDLKLPGSEDAVGVFNRRDYVASGGEALADLAERLIRAALGDGSG